jgi:hypothetical protein
MKRTKINYLQKPTLASEGCLNRDHVDILLLNPASAAGIYPTRMTLID